MLENKNNEIFEVKIDNKDKKLDNRFSSRTLLNLFISDRLNEKKKIKENKNTLE